MLLLWLLPLTLFSLMGDASSWKHAEDLLDNFTTDVLGSPTGDSQQNQHRLIRGIISPWYDLSDEYKESRKPQRSLLMLFAAFPVLLGFAFATGVDITPPTEFSCRAVFNILSITAWCLSGCFTALLLSCHSIFGRRISTLILAKDFLIGVPLLLMIVLSACGWFNSCYCSSGFIWRRSMARVDLVPDWAYSHNAKVYIACVTIGLTLEVQFFVSITCAQRRMIPTIWSTKREAFRTLRRHHFVRSTATNGAIGVGLAEIETKSQNSPAVPPRRSSDLEAGISSTGNNSIRAVHCVES
jgi:hypothetical protein